MTVQELVEEEIYGFPDEAEEAFRKINSPETEEDAVDAILKGAKVDGFETIKIKGGTEGFEQYLKALWDLTNADDFGCPTTSFETNIVRQQVLVVFGVTESRLGTLANRTGCICLGYDRENLFEAARSLDAETLKELADTGLTVGLMADDNSNDTKIDAAQRGLLLRAKEVGIPIDCYYLRLVPNANGKTLPVNNCFSPRYRSYRLKGWARRIYCGGVLLRKQADIELVRPDVEVELVKCDWRELNSQKQAALLESRMSIGNGTEGTPERLDEIGRLPTVELPEEAQVVLMRVPHGGGKTHQVKQICQKINQAGGMSIHVCPLRSLVKAAGANYNALGKQELDKDETLKSTGAISRALFNAEDADGNTIGRDISLCPESLTEYSRSGLSLPKLAAVLEMDCNKGKTINVVLDELPATIERLQTSSTIRKVGLTLKVFGELLKLAISSGGKIICMSADLNQSHVSLILRLAGLGTDAAADPMKVVTVNPGFSCPQDFKRTIHFSKCINSTTQRLVAAVKEGMQKQRTTLLLVNIKSETSTKSTVTFEGVIRRLCGAHTRILTIDADRRAVRGSEEERFMEAPTVLEQMQMMDEFDVIISTGCITSGVNWDAQAFDGIPDDVIHKVFVIDTGKWGATNTLQAANRVRNQDISVEICAPTQAHNKTFFGFNPTPDDVKEKLTNIADNFSSMLKGIDSDLVLADECAIQIPEPEPSDNFCVNFCNLQQHAADVEAAKQKPRPWFDSYCELRSLEEIERRNPYVAVRTLAALNGYYINEIDDARASVFDKTQMATFRKNVTSANSEWLASLLGGEISMEAFERLRELQSTVETERMVCNGLTSEAITERIQQIQHQHRGLVNQHIKGKTKANRRERHQARKQLTLLTTALSLDLRALLLLQRHNKQELIAFTPDDGNFWCSTEVKTHALEMLARDGATQELFIEPVTATEYAALLTKTKPSPMERLMKQRGECADIAVLDSEFTNKDGWSATQWCRFARSRMPKFLFLRMLLTLEEGQLTTLKKYFLRKSKDELTAARLELPAASIRAAEALVKGGIARHILKFEGRYAVERTTDNVELAAAALGVTPAGLIATDAELSAISKSKSAMWKFVVNAVRSQADDYPRHRLLWDASPHIQALSEDISKRRNALGGLFDGMSGQPQGSGNKQKHCAYLAKALREISRCTLTKVGEVRTSQVRQQYWVMLEDDDLVPTSIARNWIERTWNRLASAVKMDDAVKVLLDAADF